MTAIQVGLTVALCALPLYWLVRRELDKLADPRYLREQGIVLVDPQALEGHAAPIGTYMGREIWESVTFMGMVYRFDRIVARRQRETIGAHELYLEPGLVYVTG